MAGWNKENGKKKPKQTIFMTTKEKEKKKHLVNVKASKANLKYKNRCKVGKLHYYSTQRTTKMPIY